MKKKIRALVLTGFGLNCDYETAHALRLAGAIPDRVHINALIDGSVSLDAYKILVFGGGFSWGDDHGAGVIQAVRMKTHMGDQMLEFIEKDRLVIGICNGFQVIANLGLLPGFKNDEFKRCVALITNDSGNFRDDWVTLKINRESPCVFTKNLDTIDLPVRHGEGKFFAEPSILERLISNNQIVLQYAIPGKGPADGAYPFNPNGSLMDIAGICDPTGRVFGLMPHPEAYHRPENHPMNTRLKETARRSGRQPGEEQPLGTRFFENAVRFFN